MDLEKEMVLLFCSNLMTSTRISESIKRLGYELLLFERAEEVENDYSGPANFKYSKNIRGAEAILLERISEIKPALVIFDMENDFIPWERWLLLIKSSPATMRYPVLCFGPHIETVLLKKASDYGADTVLPRSKFVKNPSPWINRSIDERQYHGNRFDCGSPLSGEAVRGLHLFNGGDYFDAHEHLEKAWYADKTSARQLYRALLQVSVAYYQILELNYYGAVKILLRLRQWIDPLPDTCRGVDVRGVRDDVKKVYDELVRLGSERIEDFDQDLFNQIRFERLQS